MSLQAGFVGLGLILAIGCTSSPETSSVGSKGEAPEMSGESIRRETKAVVVGTTRLHYLERGTGPLILLLHGFPEYSGMWRDYLEPLGTSNHVVAPDLRGYNLSAQPGAVSEYALEKLMGDVTGLVQKLGHNKVCLVGHDWGGLLSWYVAAIWHGWSEDTALVVR